MEDLDNILKQCQGFEWDKGNIAKSWLKHTVNPFETEKIFFNQPFIITKDKKHSQEEDRFYGLGKTGQDRFLFVCFTIRNRLIRIISSRDMNRKERKAYKTHEENNS